MKDILLNVQTTINSASVNLLALIFFADGAIFIRARQKYLCKNLWVKEGRGLIFRTIWHYVIACNLC